MPQEIVAIAGVVSVIITAIISPVVVARLRAQREATEVEGLEVEHAERVKDAAIALVAPLEKEVLRLSQKVDQLEADLQQSLGREHIFANRVADLERRLREADKKEAELSARLAESRAREVTLSNRVRELELQNEELSRRLQLANEEIERLKARVLGVNSGADAQ